MFRFLGSYITYKLSFSEEYKIRQDIHGGIQTISECVRQHDDDRQQHSHLYKDNHGHCI